MNHEIPKNQQAKIDVEADRAKRIGRISIMDGAPTPPEAPIQAPGEIDELERLAQQQE